MSEKEWRVASHVSIQFTWRDEAGNIPEEHVLDALQQEALQQAAQGIMAGAQKGALQGNFPDGDGATRYQGEWVLDLDWRIKSRKL